MEESVSAADRSRFVIGKEAFRTMVAPAAQAPPILGTDNHGRFILIMIVKQRQRMIPGRHDRSGKRSGGCGGKCAQKSAAGCRRTYRRITGRTDRKSTRLKSSQ